MVWLEPAVFTPELEEYIQSTSRGRVTVMLIEASEIIDSPLAPLVSALQASPAWHGGESSWVSTSVQATSPLYLLHRLARWRWLRDTAKVWDKDAWFYVEFGTECKQLLTTRHL